MSRKLTGRLQLELAVEQEAKSWRNLVPAEPWWPKVNRKRSDIADWVSTRLNIGQPSAPTMYMMARKFVHGTRPVAFMGTAERIAYRALTMDLLSTLPDRSPEAYRDFLQGPIDHALRISPFETSSEENIDIAYVVQTDIAGFYEYIDHSVLQRQLELQTGRLDAVDALMSLLQQTEGRSFGLPQLLDPSDWLSEIYIQIVERDLIRRGLLVWRFNDDFRIACPDYSHALEAIEILSEAARRIGLTISDHKTYTPSLATYVLKHTGIELSRVHQSVDPSDVEVIVTDYATDDPDASLEKALNTLTRLGLNNGRKTHSKLHTLEVDDYKNLRGAVAALTHFANPEGLSAIPRLMSFIPALTPRLCDYIEALSSDHSVEQHLREVMSLPHLSEWQAMWLASVIRRTQVVQSEPATVEWLQNQRARGHGRPLGAETILALAAVGEITFDELDQALRVEPEVLAPYHVSAMQALDRFSEGRCTTRLRAVAGTSPLFSAILSN